MNAPYGITITGNVAVVTLSVPALWWVAVTMLAGLFLTFSTVREWVAGVFDRVWKQEKQSDKLLQDILKGGMVSIQPCDASSHKGMKIWE